MSSWIPSLSQLEEGNVGSLLQRIDVHRYTKNTMIRAYTIALAWALLVMAVRPMPSLAVENASVPIVPSDSFVHVVSNPVPNDKVRQSTHVTLMRSEEDCIAAVHLGVPVRQMRVGDKSLTNPSIVRQGSKISKAYETSLFYPERPPKLVHRFLPVTLSFVTFEGETLEETFEGGEGHCVLHMMNQFQGRSIYDE